jgi:hypothetical protein
VKQIVLVILAAGLLALGCGDATPTGSGAPAGSGTAMALADSDVPVSADFEEEAEKGISAANYKGELDNLEKEVGAE